MSPIPDFNSYPPAIELLNVKEIYAKIHPRVEAAVAVFNKNEGDFSEEELEQVEIFFKELSMKRIK